MGINNGIGRVWAANAGEEGRPAGVGPVWIENIDAITPSGSGGSTYTGGNGIDVDNDNDTISLDAEAQAAIDSYVTNSGSFLTDADLSGYATETWVQGQDYVNDNEMSEYVTEQTSAFVTSADIPPQVVVDQTYSPDSTNPQAGTAVAQAIASIPSSSYTAGDGIDITSGEISVKAGTGLEISDISSTVTENLSCSEFSKDGTGTYAVCIAPLTSDILNAINTSDGFSFTISRDYTAWGDEVYVALYLYGGSGDPNFEATSQVVFGTALTPVSGKIPSGTTFTLKSSEVNATKSAVTLSQVVSRLPYYRIGIINYSQSTGWSYLGVGSSEVTETPTPSSVVTATRSTTTTIQDALCVANPVPAYDNTDEGKVLGVTSGATDWVNLPDTSDMATQTWTSQNYFPIDGLQIVGSSAEASGANIIYIVSGSNA